MGFKATDSALLPAESCPEHPGWLVGKGHGDPAKERVLPSLPSSFRVGVASWASWRISRSSDRSQTCSWEGCVSYLMSGFWNPSQLLATDPSPHSQAGPFHLSIHPSTTQGPAPADHRTPSKLPFCFCFLWGLPCVSLATDFLAQ